MTRPFVDRRFDTIHWLVPIEPLTLLEAATPESAPLVVALLAALLYTPTLPEDLRYDWTRRLALFISLYPEAVVAEWEEGAHPELEGMLELVRASTVGASRFQPVVGSAAF